MLEDEISDFDDIKRALLGCTAMTFAAAAEAVFTADKGEILNIPSRQAGDKLVRWIEKMAEGTETNRQIFDRIAMGVIKSHTVLELKTYIVLAKPTDRQEFHAMIEQWVRSQPVKKPMYKTMGGYRYGIQNSDTSKYSTSTKFGSSTTFKKPLTCYACGKVGHVSRECRSKPLETHKQASTSINSTEVKPVVCFMCREVGHKSPQCPKRPRDKVKKILIPEDQIGHLSANDVMARIGDTRKPMTFDTGAQISIVPIELVKEGEFTGKTSKLSYDKWVVV